jgi:ribosomal protein L37AE/L43A
MVDYKIIKYCRLCKTRFVVNKGESKIHYCKKCQDSYNKQNKEKEVKK